MPHQRRPAGAARATAAVPLPLSTPADRCWLQITDNGGDTVGRTRVQPDEARTFGLAGIRERARVPDGTVAVETPERSGFSLIVSFPLHAVINDETL
jgi:signal transduction histidine kinase